MLLFPIKACKFKVPFDAKDNAPEAVILVAFVFMVPPGEFMVKFVADGEVNVLAVIAIAATGEFKDITPVPLAAKVKFSFVAVFEIDFVTILSTVSIKPASKDTLVFTAIAGSCSTFYIVS